MLAAPGPPAVAQANTNSPQVSFSRSAYFTGEGESVVVKVVRNGGGEGVVNYTPADASTSSGKATANADYTPASGQLAFDSYETEKSFTVSALQDTELENAESHIVKLPQPFPGGDWQGVPDVKLVTRSSAAVVILNVVPRYPVPGLAGQSVDTGPEVPEAILECRPCRTAPSHNGSRLSDRHLRRCSARTGASASAVFAARTKACRSCVTVAGCSRALELFRAELQLPERCPVVPGLADRVIDRGRCRCH